MDQEKELQFIQMLEDGVSISKARKTLNMRHVEAVELAARNGFQVSKKIESSCQVCGSTFKSTLNTQTMCKKCYKLDWAKKHTVFKPKKERKHRKKRIDVLEREKIFVELLKSGKSMKSARLQLNINSRKAKKIALENGFTPWASSPVLSDEIIISRLHPQMQLLGRKMGSRTDRKVFEVMCKDCGLVYLKYPESLSHGCQNCYTATQAPTEKSILSWVQSFYPDAITKYLGKKQVDIFIPNLNLGIEYCGLYWHTEDRHSLENRYCHHNKMLLCQEHGIRLITIFEDEWLTRNAQVRNFIKSAIKVHDKKIHGRNCVIESLDKQTAKDFLDANHIQGKTQFSVAFGLMFEHELVGVMTGNDHHRNNAKNAHTLVLNRLCFKDGYSITGGSSKLFKALSSWAKTHDYKRILSWSDNRWSIGSVYQAMGFSLEQELKPDYSYVKGKKRFSKQSLKKNDHEKTLGLTEGELRNSQGFSRIWDCGKKRWVFDL